MPDRPRTCAGPRTPGTSPGGRGLTSFAKARSLCSSFVSGLPLVSLAGFPSVSGSFRLSGSPLRVSPPGFPFCLCSPSVLPSAAGFPSASGFPFRFPLDCRFPGHSPFV